ncbi:unnamed protein product [Lactuca saligna]|uniref:tRNA-splicing endonuclease subunit Sen54 N-terminal domain-containing protein n=1 Tax=Lactuca saligna TaxID=75948 RepID=A0AA35ZHS0_LACSI|nr:unnamed protein product [Lactuca saligna]
MCSSKDPEMNVHEQWTRQGVVLLWHPWLIAMNLLLVLKLWCHLHKHHFNHGNRRLGSDFPKLQFRKNISKARWKQDLGMAEIVSNKGKLWTTTGIVRGGKLYSFLEDTLFLAEIGALHLLDDEDKCILLEDIYKKVAECLLISQLGCGPSRFLHSPISKQKTEATRSEIDPVSEFCPRSDSPHRPSSLVRRSLSPTLRPRQSSFTDPPQQPPLTGNQNLLLVLKLWCHLHKHHFNHGNRRLGSDFPKLQFRKNISKARWKQDLGMAEIVSNKGKLWTTTGIVRGGKLYSYLEDTLFLAEIGALHLLDDEDKCIPLEDIYKKVAEGVGGSSWESFEVYRHLKSLGYIIKRHGVCWSMKHGKSEEKSSIMEVTESFSSMEINEASKRLVFDVYPPNSKFRKSNPGNPIFILSIISGNPPTKKQIEELEGQCEGIPLKFCYVEHGRTEKKKKKKLKVRGKPPQSV